MMESSINNPFSSRATRLYQFCVPDEWYRRPTPRITSLAPSEATLKQLSELEEDEEDEGEGTAKQRAPDHFVNTTSPDAERTGSPESTGTFSTKRLSSLFDGWLGSASSSTSQEDGGERARPVVSEPLSIPEESGGQRGATKPNFLSGNESDSSLDDEDFEQMIVICFN